MTASAGKCGRCGKPLGNPLTHTCTVRSDFRQRRADAKKAARPVHGSWGSGRLLRTSLISVLLTSKGQLLVGAVTPAVLYADAAKVK